MSLLWVGHRRQHDPSCYGVPLGLGTTVAVPGPAVLDMEGDCPGLCRPLSSPASGDLL